jgi:aminomethyltransferase
MGRIFFRGPGALDYANRLITNDLAALAPDQLLYSALCNPEGGIIDDVTVYHLGDAALMVVNAANRDAVRAWIRSQRPAGVDVTDATEMLAQLALQGPEAQQILPSPFAEAVRDLGYYHHATVTWEGEPVLISRNGYTGEDGFEVYLPTDIAVRFWESLLAWGRPVGLEPIGLAARDSLRMEVNYALYGHELDAATSPLEAGLRWVVKFKKPDFVGRDALVRQRDAGLQRTLVGFAVEGKRLARPGYPILSGGAAVGRVTSGGYCPSLDRGMGMGFVPPELKEVGTELEIEAPSARLKARIVPRPFYAQGSVRKA